MKSLIFLMAFSMLIFASPVNAEEVLRLEKTIEEKESALEISDEDVKKIEEAMPSAKITDTFGERVFLICDLDTLLLYSKIGGGDGICGVDIDAKFSPAIMLGPDDFLIPLYNGAFSRTKRAVKEEEGTQLYESFQSHNLNLAWRHRFSDEWTGKINTFGTWSYNVETKDEDWGDGLYDYDDTGIDLGLRRVQRLADFELKEYTAAFEFYRRKYPNYDSLITLAEVTAPEVKEKDYRGYSFSGGYKFTRMDELALGLKYSLLLKDYKDKKVIDSDGVLTADKRDDCVHDIGLEYSRNIGNNWILGINNDYRIYDSNQNFYDSRGTAIVDSSDVYTEDYYDFYSIGIKPTITYLKEISPERKLVITLAYGFTYKKYNDRSAQDSLGEYEDDEQADKISDVALNIRYPLNKRWALRFLAEYMNVRSNMDYERYYVYDYELYNTGAGFSYSF